MSTHAAIAFETEEGTRTAIYLHADGYPEGAGRTLAAHYDTLEKVRDLLALGDLSSLGETPEDPGDLWRTGDSMEEWRERSRRYCRSYKSRGEDCPAKTYTTIRTLARTYGAEYVYVFHAATSTWSGSHHCWPTYEGEPVSLTR